MKYTVVITREFAPDAFVATVPLLDVVTYGDSVEDALAAAQEAITLDLRGRQRHQEEIPVEPPEYAVLQQVEVALPPLTITANGSPAPGQRRAS